MTQQSLITRLKAVEEALANSEPNFVGEYWSHGRQRDRHNDALSDLRKLIKEAKRQKPKAWADAWGEPFINPGDIDGESAPAPLYTALGEKP